MNFRRAELVSTLKAGALHYDAARAVTPLNPCGTSSRPPPLPEQPVTDRSTSENAQAGRCVTTRPHVHQVRPSQRYRSRPVIVGRLAEQVILAVDKSKLGGEFPHACTSSSAVTLPNRFSTPNTGSMTKERSPMMASFSSCAFGTKLEIDTAFETSQCSALLRVLGQSPPALSLKSSSGKCRCPE